MEFDVAEYEKLVQKLRKNRENVPERVLKTKYAKAYKALKEDVKTMTQLMLQDLLFPWPISADRDPEELMLQDGYRKRGQEIVDQATRTGIMKKISRKVFQEYDIFGAADIASESMAELIRLKAYGPYFQKHCWEDGGLIHTDLYKHYSGGRTATWDEECREWFYIDKKTGVEIYLLGADIPPDESDLQKELDKWLRDHPHNIYEEGDEQ